MGQVHVSFEVAIKEFRSSECDSETRIALENILRGLRSPREYLAGDELSEVIPSKILKALKWLKEIGLYYQQLSVSVADLFAELALGCWSNANRVMVWRDFTDAFIWQNSPRSDEEFQAYMNGVGMIGIDGEASKYEVQLLVQIMRVAAAYKNASRKISGNLDKVRVNGKVFPAVAETLQLLDDRVADGFRYPEKRQAFAILQHAYLRFLEKKGARPIEVMRRLAEVKY